MRDKLNKDLPPNYFEGIPVGIFSVQNWDQFIMIFNHLEITVHINYTIEGHQRIVGFEVEPFSIAEGPKRAQNDPHDNDGPLYLKVDDQFRFSYRIISKVSFIF
jgi:hypothetical protein